MLQIPKPDEPSTTPGDVPPAWWWAELAWTGDRVAAGVLIEASGGRFTAVTPGVEACPAGAERLAGLTLPGFANAHSHAFHRALRGRTQEGRGTFWSWREQMYAVAARLTPETYHALARATYAEMALAGFTCVGEFHYVHHTPSGAPYADPNAMGEALLSAAAGAGIRVTLLDTCYLTGAIGRPLEGPQLRFGDGDAGRWAARVEAIRPPAHARVGAALHSVRAVPPDQARRVAAWAAERGARLHVHLSEQRVENEACAAAYGRTPARVLAGAGALGPATSAVHATHVSGEDVELLGAAGVAVCMCPTTERDLGDGIGPARDLAGRGVRITLGTDSHALIDPFEEMRALELDERLRSEARGHWSVAELLAAGGRDGHASLGWPEAGVIAPGAVADLVVVGLDSPRLAGARSGDPAGAAVFAATAADVRRVVAGGRTICLDGRSLLTGDVARELELAIQAVVG